VEQCFPYSAPCRTGYLILSHWRFAQFSTLMPRVETPKHSVRVQRAYGPLLFRTRFQPERRLTPPPLPWGVTFPPHVDDQPADDATDDPLGEGGGASASQVTPVKMKKPNGEPGRSGDRGFNLKSALNLPGGVYEELLVSLCSISSSVSDPFYRMKSIALLRYIWTWRRQSRINHSIRSSRPIKR
jgi:hypothetical protein